MRLCTFNYLTTKLFRFSGYPDWYPFASLLSSGGSPLRQQMEVNGFLKAVNEVSNTDSIDIQILVDTFLFSFLVDKFGNCYHLDIS